MSKARALLNGLSAMNSFSSANVVHWAFLKIISGEEGVFWFVVSHPIMLGDAREVSLWVEDEESS